MPAASPPSWLLRLADSELAALQLHRDGRAELVLAAAQLRHPVSGDWGHAPGLRLRFSGAVVVGEVQPGRLREARLWCDGRWLTEWPVPGEWQADGAAPLRLEWTGPYGDPVALSARMLQVALGEDSAAAWRPWLQC